MGKTGKSSKSDEIDISERMVPEFHKGHSIYGEHIIRYEAAKELVKDKIVLDIASGSGYGTQMLATTAKKVIGIDVSDEAITYAKSNYQRKNIEYILGDGETIPLEDASVEIVVSFETIEHIKDYHSFMKELKRVLKPDGLLVLSTPNELEFAEGNHFHLHEFKEQELLDLIHAYFSNTKPYYQGDWVYSAMLPKDYMSSEQQNIKELKNMQLAPLKSENYLYFYVLCANRKITESITYIGAMSEHWSARQLMRAHRDSQAYIDNVNEVLQATRTHAKQLEETIELKQNHIANLENQLEEIKKTKSWKLYQKVKKVSKTRD